MENSCIVYASCQRPLQMNAVIVIFAASPRVSVPESCSVAGTTFVAHV